MGNDFYEINTSNVVDCSGIWNLILLITLAWCARAPPILSAPNEILIISAQTAAAILGDPTTFGKRLRIRRESYVSVQQGGNPPQLRSAELRQGGGQRLHYDHRHLCARTETAATPRS